MAALSECPTGLTSFWKYVDEVFETLESIDPTGPSPAFFMFFVFQKKINVTLNINMTLVFA
jgi:hypothetical protein